MADQIKVDWVELKHSADILRRDAHSMQDFFYDAYSALKPHDPSNGGGDEVGKAIGGQYFEQANNLLHAGGIAALLLIDIADLATSGANTGAQVERYLEKINRDLSTGDVKLPPPLPSTGNGSAGGLGSQGSAHRH